MPLPTDCKAHPPPVQLVQSRYGRDFSCPSRPTAKPTHLLYNWYRVFPESKAAGAWCSPPSSFQRRSCKWVGDLRLPSVPGVAFTFNQNITRPSTAEVKIEWSCISTPPTYLHGMNIRKSLHLRSVPSNKLSPLARRT
jgi:hypothetical protein